MNYKKADKWRSALAVASVLIALIAQGFSEIIAVCVILMISAVLFAVSAVTITVKYRRCPHCHELFPFRSPIPMHCPNCGMKV